MRAVGKYGPKDTPEGMRMEICERKEKGSVVIAITGKLDSFAVPELEKVVEENVSKGEKFLVFNLSGLTHISSAGLRSFLVPAKKLKTLGGSVTFVALTENISRILKTAGLYNSIFKVYDSEKDAIEANA
jgi:anti-anti-sigma factor